MSVSIILDNYRIITDELQWVLQEKAGKQKERWKAIGYHTSLPFLLKHLGELKLRAMPARSLEDITRNCQSIQEEFREIARKLALTPAA